VQNCFAYERIPPMNANQVVSIAGLVVVVIVVVCLAGVMFAALKRAKGNIVIHLIWRGVIDFMLKIARLNPFPPRGERIGIKSKKRQPWHFRHWRAICAVSLMGFMIAAPVRWWMEKPAAWRMLVSDEWKALLSLAAHDPKEPVVVPLGGETRHKLKEVLDAYTDRMRADHYQSAEVWVLDHYWQYWNTQNLDEYMDANKMFVANGGRIRRMFLLTREELREPEVQAVLQRQCQIGRPGAEQTGNGFELWRADPDTIKNQEEYEALARAFRQLPNTEKSFDNFDVVQFNDVLYYSADFSTNHRALGSSIWMFNPEHVNKIDLRPLFKKSIAERISCDQPVLRAAREAALEP
jgi:hypothetical protein